jgi:hypothetical protein
MQHWREKKRETGRKEASEKLIAPSNKTDDINENLYPIIV